MELLLAAITEQITFARNTRLPMTAKFLEMAKLDLQMQLHLISDEEIRSLCEWLESVSQERRPKNGARQLSNRRKGAEMRKSNAPDDENGSVITDLYEQLADAKIDDLNNR
jgi:hypothetical protein